MLRYPTGNSTFGRVNVVGSIAKADRAANKMNRFRTYALFITLVFLSSCSNDREPEDRAMRGDHVWKDQVQAYDKAREVEGLLEKGAKKNKDALEQQIQ